MLRTFLVVLTTLALSTALQPASATDASVPLGFDLGASGPVNPRGGEGHPGYAEPNRGQEIAHSGRADVHGTGLVNSVDTAAHKINLTHQPIPQIGWPTMTMDFSVAPSVDLGAVKPGSQIEFSMEQGPGGMYVIQSISAKPGSGQPAPTSSHSNHQGH